MGESRAHADVSDMAAEAPYREPRRLLWGTVVVQGSRAAQVVAVLAVTTALARNFSLSAFGVYGLTLSFTTYIGFARSSVDASATKAIAEALDANQRDRAFTTALVVFGAIGLLGGVVLAGVGNLAVGLLRVPSRLEGESRVGIVGLSALIAIGWPLSAFASVLYGEQRYKLVALAELAGQLTWMVLMLLLVLVVQPPLWVLIAVGGSGLFLIGAASALAMVGLKLPYRFRASTLDWRFVRGFLTFAGYMIAGGVTDVIIYGMDRTVLGIFRPAATIGLYEGISRPHSLMRQVQGTLLVTVFPTTARYLVEGDDARVRSLLLRGTRYVVAVTLPPIIALMVLAKPLLVGWLGVRYGAAATALTIFLSYFVVMSSLGVGASMIQAAGRVRAWAVYGWVLAITNLALSLVLTSALGLEGVVLGTSIAYVITYPIVLWLIVSTLPVSVREIVREIWLPCYSIGLLMAAALLAFSSGVSIHGLAPVIATGAVATIAYWVLFWLMWLRPGERDFFRSLIVGARVRRPAVSILPRS